MAGSTARSKRLSTGWRGLTTARCWSRCAISFVTLVVAVLMLGGRCGCSAIMPKGFIPSQDSGFFFAFTMAGQDISFESMAQHEYAVVGDRRGTIRTWPTSACFCMGGNQGGFFARLKPRDERALSVDQIIAELRPKFFAGAGHTGVSAESAADHRERPVHRQRLSAHAAEHRPEGAVRLDAARRAGDDRAARLRGREHRPADRQPAGDGGHRPRPRACRWASRRSRSRTR